MATPPPNERVKANRLRAKVKVAPQAMKPDEVEWLNDYETKQEATREARGASRAHKVSFTEESMEAAGTGSAAEVAAAAVFSREEGRRFDALLDRVILATEKTCSLHERMCEALLNQQIENGKVIQSLLVGYRQAYLDKTELEADAIRAGAEGGDEITKMAAELLPQLLPAIMAGMSKKKVAAPQK